MRVVERGRMRLSSQFSRGQKAKHSENPTDSLAMLDTNPIPPKPLIRPKELLRYLTIAFVHVA